MSVNTDGMCCSFIASSNIQATFNQHSSNTLLHTGWLAGLQAKRRVYTLQSGSKAAAGKRKRLDATSSDGTSAGTGSP